MVFSTSSSRISTKARGAAASATLKSTRMAPFLREGCVLDPGHHVSYPYVFEDQGAIYMLPEISASGDLVLYEATAFPYQWRPAAVLLPGVAGVDATVFQHEGLWWIFATRADRGANQNLFVWHASSLTGPWTAHAGNPVKTDARSARPAGTPFVADGRLIRPSQDNSHRYGGRLILNRVDILTPIDFSESAIGVVEPRAVGRRHGLHTLSAAGNRTLVDANSLRFVKEVMRLNMERKFPSLQRTRPD